MCSILGCQPLKTRSSDHGRNWPCDAVGLLPARCRRVTGRNGYPRGQGDLQGHAWREPRVDVACMLMQCAEWLLTSGAGMTVVGLKTSHGRFHAARRQQGHGCEWIHPLAALLSGSLGFMLWFQRLEYFQEAQSSVPSRCVCAPRQPARLEYRTEVAQVRTSAAFVLDAHAEPVPLLQKL